MIRARQQVLIASGIGLIILIAVIALVVSNAISSGSTQDTTNIYLNIPVSLTEDGTPIVGSANATVTLVEFLDYSCYQCAEYQAVINTFIEEYVATGRARLEIRILAGLDPAGSAVAARTALCAAEQNAFLQMNSELLRMQQRYGQNAFTADHIRSAGGRLGLDLESLSLCTQNTALFSSVVRETVDLALALNVQTMPSLLLRYGKSTPVWLFENGLILTGQIPLDVLRQAIEMAPVTP